MIRTLRKEIRMSLVVLLNMMFALSVAAIMFTLLMVAMFIESKLDNLF